MEWLGAVKADVREVHERHADHRQKSTTGRNLPPVDLGADHRQVYVATTGRNLPPNLKKNPKKNPQYSAHQGAPDAGKASPDSQEEQHSLTTAAENGAVLAAAPATSNIISSISTQPGSKRRPAAKGGGEFEAA